MNLQLSIRSVVADSNSQASKLHDSIAKLKDDMEVSTTTLYVMEGLSLLVLSVREPGSCSGWTAPSR